MDPVENMRTALHLFQVNAVRQSLIMGETRAERHGVYPDRTRQRQRATEDTEDTDARKA